VEQADSSAITGPAGAGKTVFLRALRDALPEARYKMSYLKVTGLGRRDLCRELAVALELPPVGQYPTLVRRLQDGVLNTITDGRRWVLLIDEAHDMPVDVLPIFRILTNFDMDSRLALPVVLCGQPQLLQTLLRDSLDSLAMRLTAHVQLFNLSADRTRDYVAHRLEQAGARTAIFADTAVDTLFEVARGNMRAIDTMAFNALLVAAERNSKRVETEHLIEARKRVLR
jgi:general secretion pathway protein A